MKTSLKISRLTLLLGIAIWGNHAYASQCSSSADPLVVSTSCDALNVSSSKGSITVSPGVSIVNYYGTERAATIEGGVTTSSFTNNGSIASSPYLSYVNSGMAVYSNTSIATFTNNGAISMSGNVGASDYYGALTLDGKISNFINAGTIASTGNGTFGILMGGNASIGTLTNQTGQSIAGAASGILMGSGASIGTLTNNGFITGSGPSTASPTVDGIVSNGITLLNGATLGNLTNAGAITGGKYGVSNQGEIASVFNSGTITGGVFGLYNQTNAKVGNVNNSGSITSTQSSVFNSSAISNGGEINSITNSGNISAYQGTYTDQHAGIQNLGTGSIYTIQNSGSISATNAIDNKKQNGMSGYIGTINNTGFGAALAASSHAINNDGVIDNINNTNSALIYGTVVGIQNTNQIGQITNSASIGGAVGIINDGVSGTANITAINNSGSILGETRAITNGAQGVIGVITNTGNIQATNTPAPGNSRVDIYNDGSITTLNNAQKTLYYQGNLPTNYNIIINSATNYGSLNTVDTRSSITSFGISPLSTGILPGSATYTNVLSGGISASNLKSTNGVYDGGFVTATWQLTPQSAGSSTYDLGVKATATAPVISYSTSGQNLANSIANAYNAIAANPNAANPILANGQTFTSNVNSVATAAQASQIALQSNAEGYSSNRTIRLEQMNSVSNTVLDRIDSPSGKGTNATNRVQLDDGRYLWGDIGGSRGNVNSYNNLASFGYNLVDVIIGGDLGRDSQKSYGVFGGVGYSDMTNSQTVVQSFNSTSYYLGGYGSYYLPENLKLSGVGGYVYSANNSSRSLPSVAGFTGGNGKDSYGSNGIYAAAKVSKDYVINDSFTLVPFAGQSYAQFWTKGVTETGGGDFNVSIASATSYSTVSFAGLDLVMPLVKGVKDPLSLITFYKFGYDWFANSNSAHSVTATYTNLPLAPQTYVGANMGPISQQIGVGLQGAISKDVSARIGAVASFNTNGQEYGGGAELRFKF
jgi:hypothetical protein